MINNKYNDNVFIMVTLGAAIISKLSYNNKKAILLYKLLVGKNLIIEKLNLKNYINKLKELKNE